MLLDIFKWMGYSWKNAQGKLFITYRCCIFSTFFMSKGPKKWQKARNLLQKIVFLSLLQKCLIPRKNRFLLLKMNISASVWSMQHPNAGQNIQHIEPFGSMKKLSECQSKPLNNVLHFRKDFLGVKSVIGWYQTKENLYF